MLDNQRYVTLSLELHLVFARLMKEHAIFLKASLTPVSKELSDQAEFFQNKFAEMLMALTQVSQGYLSSQTLTSGELITDYTLGIEQKTQNFTGIKIDQDITRAEAKLYFAPMNSVSVAMLQYIKDMNQYALSLIDSIIVYKKMVLDHVVSCRIFLNLYPLNVSHIIHEAEYYRNALDLIENRIDPEAPLTVDTEQFWNTIMEQHALFVRGLLDPSEAELMTRANSYVQAYDLLNERLQNMQAESLSQITTDILNETTDYAGFNESGADGIARCKIRSMILPLIADHNLRETNHYLRILKQFTATA